ncbi:NAD(P)-binding protein [Mycolicibacterium sp. ELW1]|uniref:NAD(P)-binding protein n=1 Tax=Mycobacteriaceae TaxID=1762 RepID=UPI001AEFF026|nr:NAD(P)-binding protein [Mycobacterium sp. ELW1]
MTANVAVIGAGPAGLVVSRWLLSQGLEPSIFEQGPTLGGQWTAQPGRSGVWPGMHTNTSRILTAFSDLPLDGDLVSLGLRKTRMNLAAITFARAAGVEPRLERWPDLRRALLFGPLAPSCFRLEGPDALPDSAARFAREAAAFGAITDNELTLQEHSYWSSVEQARTHGHREVSGK